MTTRTIVKKAFRSASVLPLFVFSVVVNAQTASTTTVVSSVGLETDMMINYSLMVLSASILVGGTFYLLRTAGRNVSIDEPLMG